MEKIFFNNFLNFLISQINKNWKINYLNLSKMCSKIYQLREKSGNVDVGQIPKAFMILKPESKGQVSE